MRKPLTQQANRKEMTLTLNGHLKVKTCVDPCFILFIYFSLFICSRFGGVGGRGVFFNWAICKWHSKMSVCLCENKLVWHWTMGLWKCLCLIEILMRNPTTNKHDIHWTYLFLEQFLCIRTDLHPNLISINLLPSYVENRSCFERKFIMIFFHLP